jgi:hypothetical protein
MGPSGIHELTLYTSGLKDLPAIFFYLLIAIVMHQIIQEYLLDKASFNYDMVGTRPKLKVQA